MINQVNTKAPIDVRVHEAMLVELGGEALEALQANLLHHLPSGLRGIVGSVTHLSKHPLICREFNMSLR